MEKKEKDTNKQPVNTTKILLHFNTSNTIVMNDTKDGKPIEDTINELLPFYAWGKEEFNEKKGEKVWVLGR